MLSPLLKKRGCEPFRVRVDLARDPRWHIERARPSSNSGLADAAAY